MRMPTSAIGQSTRLSGENRDAIAALDTIRDKRRRERPRRLPPLRPRERDDSPAHRRPQAPRSPHDSASCRARARNVREHRRIVRPGHWRATPLRHPTATQPIARPAPEPVDITRSPSLSRPVRAASSSAIGRHAAPVYPHLPITVCARDIGTSSVAITARIVDRFTCVQSHSVDVVDLAPDARQDGPRDARPSLLVHFLRVLLDEAQVVPGAVAQHRLGDRLGGPAGEHAHAARERPSANSSDASTPGSSLRSTTVAPAPSAKIVAVFLSL